MSIASVFLVLSALAPAAQAADWSSFDQAFPVFPCGDGWSGCRVNGARIDAELVASTLGLPQPADLRLDWVTLDPTSAFSPFTKLSDYPRPEPPIKPPEEQVAAMTPPRPPVERARQPQTRTAEPPPVQAPSELVLPPSPGRRRAGLGQRLGRLRPRERRRRAASARAVPQRLGLARAL